MSEPNEPLEGSSLVILKEVSRDFIAGGEIVHALVDVNVSIRPGEYVAFMGPSGSGKSTLMNIVGCLDVPTAGSYELIGRNVEGLTDAELATVRNRHIGFVFQNFNLIARISARDNVSRPLVYQRVPWRERNLLADDALGRVGLTHRSAHLPNELSGGQRQRVAIARALCSRPSILIADEPTGSLDSTTTEEILNLFDELNSGGMTIVLVTHDPDVASRCSRLISLFDGRVVSDVRSKNR